MALCVDLFGARPIASSSLWDPLSVLDSGASRKSVLKLAYVTGNPLINQVVYKFDTKEVQIIKADVPGMKKETVKVQLLEGMCWRQAGPGMKKEEVEEGKSLLRLPLPGNSNADLAHRKCLTTFLQ